jgi:immune inhibitor A
MDMKPALLVTCIACLLSIKSTCFGVMPRPTGDILAQKQTQYFRIRPSIVDVPQSPPTTKSSGTVNALVILIDFDDNQAQGDVYTADYFEAMLFGETQATLKTYFEENSYGRFSLAGDVYGWFRSPCKHRDFVNRDGTGGTSDDHGLDISSEAIDPAVCDFPLNVWGLVAQAVDLAQDVVDFSMYDNDGIDGIPSSGDDDGFVDALLVVHAGIGAEILGGLPGSENFIWSLQSNLDHYAPTAGTTVDGKGVGAFVTVPELGEIGVFAHEFCHLLGLPDLYNSETGSSVVGSLCLMDAGAWNGPQHSAGSVPSHLCAPMKYLLGWIEPERICLGCGGAEYADGAEIAPAGTSPAAYEVLDNPGRMDWTPDGTGTGEYFMLANRNKDYGYFDSYLPASGLLIWKVDESLPDNNSSTGRLVEVIQADGEVLDPTEPHGNVPGEPSDFWPGSLDKRDFTPRSVPPSNLSEGRFSGAAVENISEGSGGLVTADISVGVPKKGPAYVFPNPYRPGEGSHLRIVFLPDPGPDSPHSFHATIFDLEGDLVRELEAPDEILNNGTALWDGKDETGKYVEMGLYLYVIESSGEQATGLIGIKR